MKDFNSYINNNGRTDKSKASSSGGGMDAASVLKMLAGRYEGASEDEIISAIVAEAEKGKRNGTLTNADIDAFAIAVEPMLNPMQKRRLKKVVAFLKEI